MMAGSRWINSGRSAMRAISLARSGRGTPHSRIARDNRLPWARASRRSCRPDRARAGERSVHLRSPDSGVPWQERSDTRNLRIRTARRTVPSNPAALATSCDRQPVHGGHQNRENADGRSRDGVGTFAASLFRDTDPPSRRLRGAVEIARWSLLRNSKAAAPSRR